MKHQTFRCMTFSVLCAALLVTATGCATTSAPATSVQILEPANNAIVPTKFTVRFGVQGMTVAPAGEIVALSGHHHLLIDVDSVTAGESVPMTERYLHFGKGQTETELTLSPGVHKLTAQFANGAHQSYGKGMSHSISVTVK